MAAGVDLKHGFDDVATAAMLGHCARTPGTRRV